MNAWVLAGTTFVASAVEFIEAATIVMAVGYAQSWRAAFAGTVAATAVLGLLVAAFGSLIASAAALRWIELLFGPFLIYFGFGWVRKAVLRFSGRKAMRDEAAAYDREFAKLAAEKERGRGFAVAFQGVFVEGLEVVIIVVTFAASSARAIVWSAGGALAALVAIGASAFALRKPFARVPENALKGAVGTMLTSLGTFWTGEGLGWKWWGDDAAIFAIAGAYALIAAAVTLTLKKSVPARP
jgi:uncharacterized membrane protein